MKQKQTQETNDTINNWRLNRSQEKLLTLLVQSPVAGDCSNLPPEFGRWQDVRRLYGIKRGYLYTKIQDGTIESISLREPGKKFGCRLIYLPSVRAWLHSLLKAQQNPEE
jgi:hypothetical protein